MSENEEEDFLHVKRAQCDSGHSEYKELLGQKSMILEDDRSQDVRVSNLGTAC